MKTKKIKLLTIFFLLLPFCVVLLGAGCEKDDSEFIEIEFFKFSDFGCENDNQWSLNIGYYSDNYIITSQEEFDKIVNVECELQINFSDYVVLLGSKGFTTGALIYDEKVEENNYRIVYTVTFITDETGVAPRIKYYAIIEKPSSRKKVKIVEIVK